MAEEINFIRPQEIYDRNTGESKVRYRSYDGNDRFIPVVNGEKGVPKTMVEATHAELKAMRDGGKLTAGALYRITDYNCTTTQENTQSAGHQFDIVLLALSENKLAEEGWAMEHPTDVYDVTFADGVTKKCYLYFFDDDSDCNIVLAEDITKGHNLGIGSEDFPKIDKINKTAELGWSYYDDERGEGFITIAEPNVQYNYFQNSNLSAWKVWYCLDNDTARFAWAEKDIPTFTCNINVPSAGWSFENVRVIRGYGADYDGRYAYVVINGDTVANIATDRELKDSGDYTIYLSVNVSANAHVEILSSSVTGNGRGVIYRLIDEFNNDIKYDFKNIQFKRKLTDGQYDATNGTDTWCYTLNIWYNNMCQDASIVGNTLTDDEYRIIGVRSNSFGCTIFDYPIEEPNTITFALNDNVILSIIEDSYYNGIYDNNFGEFFNNNTIGSGCDSNIIGNHSNGNIIRNGFRNNSIGNYFIGNSIGDGFEGNVIGGSFNSNNINGAFMGNFVANSFEDITISSDTRGKNYGNNGVELATKS